MPLQSEADPDVIEISSDSETEIAMQPRNDKGKAVMHLNRVVKVTTCVMPPIKEESPNSSDIEFCEQPHVQGVKHKRTGMFIIRYQLRIC